MLEIHNSMEMVMGIRKMYKIEGAVSTKDSFLPFFMKRSILFFPKTDSSEA